MLNPLEVGWHSSDCVYVEASRLDVGMQQMAQTPGQRDRQTVLFTSQLIDRIGLGADSVKILKPHFFPLKLFAGFIYCFFDKPLEAYNHV